MATFQIQWVDGTNASVVFSDGPTMIENKIDYDTPYLIPECPLDDQDALVTHISDWWVVNKPAGSAPTETHELVGQIFKLAPGSAPEAPLVS
jgi:hypothetical protein